MHFVGSLEDGTVFDDTRARHEPYTFRVGLGFVIGGWDKGIPTMMKLGRGGDEVFPQLVGFSPNRTRHSSQQRFANRSQRSQIPEATVLC